MPVDTSTILLQIGIILIVARLFGEIAAHFLVPAVIGELVAGIILGPSLLGLVEASGVIKIFAEVGIILLLFQIGLETDFGDLIGAGKKSRVKL